MEQLGQYLDSAFSGKGTTVFICGEAGVGKTRLVNEFLNLAKKRGTKILSGWCLSGAAIPYFPLTEAFNTYMLTMRDEKAKSTMTKHLGIIGWLKGPEQTCESKPREPFSTPEIERDRTFEAVARVVLRLCASEPLILFLDDLHWADHLSLALLNYLSRKCRNSRLLIIGTYRPEEIIPTMDERIHPLEETMFSMSREDLLIKMELGRLKRNVFPDLLRFIFRSSLDEEFVERLYKETEGNPLFALETLNLLVEEGFLSEKEGRWTVTAPAERVGIPSKVHDVVIRRIARLRREERKVLDLAAVCGYSFSPDILCRLLEWDIADVLRTLVEIEQRHRLLRSADSAFEFTHDKIREVVYGFLPPELRRIYHLRIAGCLQQALAERTSDAYVADLAFHYVEGGALEKAFEYLVKLGEKAVNICANMQAIEYLSKALEATQKAPDLDISENLMKIYKLRGRAWYGQGGTTKAINDFKLLLQNATNMDDESEIEEANYWLGHVYAAAGNGNEATVHLERALEMARKSSNRLIESKSLTRLSGLRTYSLNTMEEGRTGLEEAFGIAKEIDDRESEARILWQLGLYYNWKGEFDAAKENLNQVVALAEEVGENFLKMDALLVLSIVHSGKGEYNDAILTLQECLQLSKDWGVMYFVPRVLNVFGWVYHDLSSIELALKHNNEALEIAKAHQESIGVGSPQPACLVNLGMDHLYKNEYEDAKKCFEEASDVVYLHPWIEWRFETRILLGLGEVSLAKGDDEEALKHAEDSLAISEKAGAKKYIAKGLKLKAEVLARKGNLNEAIELMESALNAAQHVGNPPLLWQIHYSLGLLLEKSKDTQKANENHAEAIALIETTASELNDPSLKNALLTASLTKAIRDAYAKTRPSS